MIKWYVQVVVYSCPVIYPYYMLSFVYYNRAHSQEVALHLRCTTHPTELWRTGGMCFSFLRRSLTKDTWSTIYTNLLCSYILTANFKDYKEKSGITSGVVVF